MQFWPAMLWIWYKTGSPIAYQQEAILWMVRCMQMAPKYNPEKGI